MAQKTTETPVPIKGTQVFDKPRQPKCPPGTHQLPQKRALHTTIHAICLTGRIAHVSACDGQEYSMALKRIEPHTQEGDMLDWDLDMSSHFYAEAFSVLGCKSLHPYIHPCIPTDIHDVD